MLQQSLRHVRRQTPALVRALVRRLRDQDYFYNEVLYPSRTRIRQFADHVEYGARALDVGTGSGVLARLALKKGAKKVVAVDINPHAVASARRNAPGVHVIHSDLFSAVEGKFDTITFAAPWSEGDIAREVHRAVFENGVTGRFLKEAVTHLNPGGAVWLQYCDASKKNFALLKDWIAESGYAVQGTWSYAVHDLYAHGPSNVILYKLVPA